MSRNAKADQSEAFQPTLEFDRKIAQYQAEANKAISQGTSQQIEIQLGHLCNNRCVFCVSGQLTADGMAKMIDSDPVMEILKSARARGCTKVTFLGGEPALQKSFIPALELSVELGFELIVIFSNGVRMHRTDFLDKLLAIGGNYEWRFSLQGATEEAHDEVVGRKGAFARILKAMKYLSDKGERITANMCITAQSTPTIDHFPSLCREYGIKQLHIDQVRPADAGRRTEADFRAMIPLYSEMAPHFDAMLSGFDDWDPNFDVNVGNYPYCMLPQWSHRIHHDGLNTLTYAANYDEIQPAFDKYNQKKVGKYHPASCEGCVFKPRCNGVFDLYGTLYGDAEFKAVSREQLKALDTENNAFVERNALIMAALQSHPLPQGLTVTDCTANAHDAVWSLTVTDARGGSLGFHLCRSSATTEHLGADVGGLGEGTLRMLPSPELDPRKITLLVHWLSTVPFTDGVDVGWSNGLAETALAVWERAFSYPRKQAATRAITAAVAGIERVREFEGWSLSGTAQLTSRMGTRVEVRDVDGRYIALLLEMDSREDRPLIRVSSDRSPEVTATETKTVLAGMVSAMQR